MKRLILIFLIILMGCVGHAKTVTFILFNSPTNLVYRAEGKLLIGEGFPKSKGLIYDVKLIEKCPCKEPDKVNLGYGYYILGIDSMTGGEWFLPTEFFYMDNHNCAWPYQLGLPNDAWKSLINKIK